MKKSASKLLTFGILAWMVATTGLFALVMLPQDSSLATLLPEPLASAQAYIFDLFYSASTLW